MLPSQHSTSSQETHRSKKSSSGVSKNEGEAQYNSSQRYQGCKWVWGIEYQKTDEDDCSKHRREKDCIQFRDDGSYILNIVCHINIQSDGAHIPSGQLLALFFLGRFSELLLSSHSLICPHCHLYRTTQTPGAFTFQRRGIKYFTNLLTASSVVRK